MPSAGPVDVALAVLLRDGTVLLQRRDRPPFEGRWELPGGKVERGEAPLEAALREAREELGLVVGAARPLMVREHRYPEGPWVRLHAFLLDDPRGPSPPRTRWVPLAEAARLDVLEGTRPILAALASKP